jgi:ABC-2 type transport system ATP-binding protein
MIEVQNLSRAYADLLAVDSVSFNIQAGEIVGLLGHNGAGKTTIMKMLSGYLEPSSGSIHINGLDLAAESLQIQEQLGYLPENLPVYPDMTVADYLDYAATLKGLTGDALTQSVKQVLYDTELLGKLLEPISTLSRGYRQRVGVAQAMLGSPKLLILDEPTNGLDPNQTQHMRELIQALAKSATVILSTHIMQEVDAICDRALILRDGRLALDEKLSTLRRSGNLLIKTNLSASRLQEEIPRMLVSGDGEYCRIALQDGAAADHVAASVASAIATAGGELYQLAPEIRDLESVFRQVNEEGGIDHAA